MSLLEVAVVIRWIPDTFQEKYKILAGATILAMFLHLFCLLASYIVVTFQGNIPRWLLCGYFHIPQQLIRPQEYCSSRVHTLPKKTGECKVWTSQRTIDRLQGSKKRSGDLNADIINTEMRKRVFTQGCQKHFCLVFPVTYLMIDESLQLTGVTKWQRVRRTERRSASSSPPSQHSNYMLERKAWWKTQAPALLDESPGWESPLKLIRDSFLNDQKQSVGRPFPLCQCQPILMFTLKILYVLYLQRWMVPI